MPKDEKNNLLNKRKFIESEVDVREMIVIDNGTESVKIGRSGLDYPSVIIPTIAGVPRVISENDATPPKRVYFGKELGGIIDAKKYTVQFSYPVEHSHITEASLEDMIDLWAYALVEILGIDPTSADLLIIDSPINLKDYKSKIIGLIFEKLKVHSILFMNSSVLSLFSIGSTIGLVTEIGHGTTTCVPVFEGFILSHALEKSNIAGLQITRKLEEQLKANLIAIKGKDVFDYASTISKVKEKNVKVAFDYGQQVKNDDRSLEERSFELPDGSIIELSKHNVYDPSEILFQDIGVNKSLPSMIQTSLERCNEDLRQELMKNAIFCGGSSMIHGLEQRMHKELSKYGQDLNISFDWQRRYSAWIGGSMVGSLSTFQQLAIVNTMENMSQSEILKRIL